MAFPRIYPWRRLIVAFATFRIEFSRPSASSSPSDRSLGSFFFCSRRLRFQRTLFNKPPPLAATARFRHARRTLFRETDVCLPCTRQRGKTIPLNSLNSQRALWLDCFRFPETGQLERRGFLFFSPPPSRSVFFSIFKSLGLFAAGMFCLIYRRDNGGLRWSNLTSPVVRSVAVFNIIAKRSSELLCLVNEVGSTMREPFVSVKCNEFTACDRFELFLPAGEGEKLEPVTTLFHETL